jgi:anti-sigma regulatory factor (Ser/Thr protein kinase)
MTQPDMTPPAVNAPGPESTCTPEPGDANRRSHLSDGRRATSRLLGRVRLRAQERSVAQARRFVHETLASYDQRIRDDAELLVSELVTNSVRYSDSARHPDGTITLTLREPVHGILRVAVTDAGSSNSEPRPRHDGNLDDERGRGLLLVESIAATWGWHETGINRTTWFELHLSLEGASPVPLSR